MGKKGCLYILPGTDSGLIALVYVLVFLPCDFHVSNITSFLVSVNRRENIHITARGIIIFYVYLFQIIECSVCMSTFILGACLIIYISNPHR